METVIKQAEENRQRSVGMANRFHEEYVPLKGEIDTMRREYLGLEKLPELHEEEGSIIPPELVFLGFKVSRLFWYRNFRLRFKNYLHSFRRFQQHTNFYSNKITTPSASFTRPTPVSALTSNPANAHHPLPPNDNPHITPLNPTHGFLPPAPPSGQGLRGMTNKPTEISNPVSRIQQSAPTLGMHPTFRSDFNVSLRYFLLFYYFIILFHLLVSFPYAYQFSFIILFRFIFLIVFFPTINLKYEICMGNC